MMSRVFRLLAGTAIALMAFVTASYADWRLLGSKDLIVSSDLTVRTVFFENPDHLDENGKLQPVMLRFFTADRQTYGVKIVQVGLQSADFSEYEACDGPISLSGGFNVKMDADGSRLVDQSASVDSAGNEPRRVAEGWLIIDGKEHTPPAAYTSGGAIADDGTRSWIVRLAEFSSLSPPNMLLQAKPVVIEHGEIGTKDVRYSSMFRAAIGTTEQGDLFGAVLADYSTRGSTLFDFAQLLQLVSTAFPSVPLDDVLALDGGPSGHLFVRGVEETHFGYPGDAFLTNFICVAPRQAR
jgi:hypothetical protein